MFSPNFGSINRFYVSGLSIAAAEVCFEVGNQLGFYRTAPYHKGLPTVQTRLPATDGYRHQSAAAAAAAAQHLRRRRDPLNELVT